MPSKPTYIFGHKNPDADSICSAIAYAKYKEAIGQEGYLPARCGNSNARIDTILRTFGQPLPLFIGDVTPRVHSIMKTRIIAAQLGETCSEVLDKIDQFDVRNLPVIDQSNQLKGTISIFNMGSYFTPKMREPLKMRHVETRISAIIRALGARALTLFDAETIQNFYVRVGAMRVESFGNHISSSTIAPSESIIVVGDREDIQLRSIEMGVRLLVITGSLGIDPAIQNAALKQKVSVIVSPYDSATTSQIIRCAGFVDTIYDTNVVTFPPEARLRDVKARIATQYAPLYYSTDPDGTLLGVFSKTDLFRPPSTRIVLVDHNELSQAVTGADEVEIAEIIDHHRLGNIPTSQPILFINRPVGSTCTIIAELFRSERLQPDPDTCGILMAGLVSDTLLLKSPTTTATDHEILGWLEKLSKVSAEELAEKIFSSGSLILSMPPEKAINVDCKTYQIEERSYSVAQIEELGFDNFWKNSDALYKALHRQRQSDDLIFSALLVTDITKQNSLLLFAGPKEIQAAFSFPKIRKPYIFDLPNIVSRKKQLMPYLSDLLETIHLPQEEEKAS